MRPLITALLGLVGAIGIGAALLVSSAAADPPGDPRLRVDPRATSRDLERRCGVRGDLAGEARLSERVRDRLAIETLVVDHENARLPLRHLPPSALDAESQDVAGEILVLNQPFAPFMSATPGTVWVYAIVVPSGDHVSSAASTPSIVRTSPVLTE